RLFAEFAHVNATLENMGPLTPQIVFHRPASRWFLRPAFLALAASIVVLGTVAKFTLIPRERSTTAEVPAAPKPSRSVAMVNNILGAKWQEGIPSLRPGDLVEPSRIRFQSGLVQLQFFNGVQLVMEGPADFEILSAEESFCHEGRFHAIVPHQANCFRVRTRQGELIDFGTEFGLDVTPDGTAAVHVFEGEVAFQRKDDSMPTRLGVGRAALISPQGVSTPLEADPNLFATYREVNRMHAMSTEMKLAEWYHGSLFWRTHPAGLAYFDFEDKDYLAGTIRAESANPYADPISGLLVGATLGEGRWPGKAGLTFGRTSDRVRISLPGTQRALTMAAWVRVNQLQARTHGLLMTDGNGSGSVHWSIDGTAHLLRLETSGGVAAGGHSYTSNPAIGPDLVGQWAFLASTYDADQGLVEHFLNGRSIGRQAIEHGESLRIGVADIGNWSSSNAPDNHFEGVIDEMMILAIRLTPDQLAGIAVSGSPY
ncbi:MAG: LamG-like jellyroll fold domain-containing protein, partial [Verrucomicrobiales bacterium]